MEKFLKRWEYQTTLPVSRETCIQANKQQFEPDVDQKGLAQNCERSTSVYILSPCLLNFCAEYIMWNPGLAESQAGIKTARRNINNLRYADDTTLMAKSEEELKSLLMREIEESETADLKLNIQKTKIIAFGPITSWQIEGEKVEVVTDFIF